ncbi:hypothetical protein KSF78_0004039 [Schistosoma japonicum]|nr:hypothetical protein KSF78_0004039 [Schistosoma japonicum]
MLWLPRQRSHTSLLYTLHFVKCNKHINVIQAVILCLRGIKF